MAVFLNRTEQKLYGASKTENSGDWHTCQFCSLNFNSRDEWTAHTFGHFETKQCSVCNVRLVQICDDWFELHTITNCQSGNHIHTRPVEHIANVDQSVDDLLNEFKQEPAFTTEYQNTDENDAFEETFAADFNPENDCDSSSNAFPMDANSFNVQFSNGRSQCKFEVTNIRKINKHLNNSEIHLKKDSRRQNSCKYCGRKFMSFQLLYNHIKQCATKKQKRQYYLGHPHRPALNFICDLCGNDKVLKTFSSLIQHMNEIHLKTATYKCRLCDKSYPSRYYLKKHLIRHESAAETGVDEAIVDDFDDGLMARKKYKSRTEKPNPEDLICNECGRQFKKHVSLVEHKSTYHKAESEFQCVKCARNYPNRYYLQKHLKRHENAEALGIPLDGLAEDIDDGLKQRRNLENDFQCKTCGQNFRSRYYLDKHSKHHKKKENEPQLELNRTVHDDDVSPEKVEIVDDDLVKRDQYVKMHPHRPTSNFVCDICPPTKILSTYYSMRKHMLWKHIIRTEMNEGKNPEQSSCSKCGKNFKTMNSFKSHKCDGGTYKPVLKLMCSFCGLRFPHPQRLKDHEDTHMRIRLPCDICGKEYFNKDSLRKHKLVHALGRRFQCNIDGCEWAFTQIQNLKRHQARKHGIVKNRYACHICSKEFPESSYHLKRHLKAHEHNRAKEYVPQPKPSVAASIT